MKKVCAIVLISQMDRLGCREVTARGKQEVRSKAGIELRSADDLQTSHFNGNLSSNYLQVT